jgi:ribonuclease BN (tRNA processing enzyme)
MKIRFLGVGEAFDERLGNTALLVRTDAKGDKRQILLDCGFTAAHAFWHYSPCPEELNAVWISHFHGDHFFGLPLIILRFWEEKRSAPLAIIGQEGVKEKVESAMELAYPGILSKLGYPLDFIEASPGKRLSILGLDWSFALSGHSSPCLSLRIERDGVSLFYSGDGNPTEGTLAVAKGCNMIVHEAFGIEENHPGHGTVQASIRFARNAGAKTLALVHINRHVRWNRHDDIRRYLSGQDDLEILLPADGDDYNLNRPGPETRGQEK